MSSKARILVEVGDGPCGLMGGVSNLGIKCQEMEVVGLRKVSVTEKKLREIVTVIQEGKQVALRVLVSPFR